MCANIGVSIISSALTIMKGDNETCDYEKLIQKRVEFCKVLRALYDNYVRQEILCKKRELILNICETLLLNLN